MPSFARRPVAPPLWMRDRTDPRECDGTAMRRDEWATMAATMWYVIDGCNLLGAEGRLGIPGAARGALGAVERFCRLSRSTAMVIFDAMEGKAPGSEFRFGERVWVRCAPADGQTDRADRTIISEVRRRAERDLVVVTDDVALSSAVRGLGAGVMDCGGFSRRLRAAVVAVGEKEAASAGIDNSEFLRAWTDSTE